MQLTADKIADGSISNTKLTTGAVSENKIAADAVTTAKILDANVTTPKLADSAVSYAKIQNVTAFKLLGNPNGSLVPPAEVGIGNALEFLGGNVNLSRRAGRFRPSRIRIRLRHVHDTGKLLVDPRAHGRWRGRWRPGR